MIFDGRTSRLITCPKTLHLDNLKACIGWKCASWRWSDKVPADAVIDEISWEKLFGFCGDGGVPVSRARLPHIK
jgi:hypothetical protein